MISIDEVRRVVNSASNDKAVGFDQIHNKIMKTETSIKFLHSLFNFCFQNSVIPLVWLKGVIHPIPKDRKLDQTLPLNYRGITLLSCVMKHYCKILNNRLTDWVEMSRLNDEQKGFRSLRGCLDHCFSLVSIIKNRSTKKKFLWFANLLLFC
eukprot:Lithocolla_globosa_v1_NODE_6236_length_1118_cov_427.875823.p1 type:complete len:152 gc:universal NODE_6236_length_1118_cov_427.875823:673-218(-)